MWHKLLASFFVLVVLTLASQADEPTDKAPRSGVGFASLLREMVDRETMARWPDPPFTLKQASSYDRRSKTPDNADWFANVDWSNFVRSEKVKADSGERTEHVMLDESGPGAIVRVWVGGYTDRGIIRFYIDGAAEPVMSGTADELIGGQKVFPEPFAATRARGRNLYAPIPYAKQIKITYDGPLPEKFGNPGQVGFWYNVNYRTYPAGTKVESFSLACVSDAKQLLAATARLLLEPSTDPQLSSGTLTFPKESRQLRSPGKRVTIMPSDLGAGEHIHLEPVNEGKPSAIQMLAVELKAKDLAAALRDVVLSIDFDGRRTVLCPLSDFFGTGVGGNALQDRWREVKQGGRMESIWPMPFQKTCRIRIDNHGQQAVTVGSHALHASWKWDDRSLYFHAGFRRDPAIDTSKKSDFNFITIGGRGVYMGDTLSLNNPLPNWWGEGDEKIFVDDEKFPSHFGTGSEDYYGYAWGNTDVFNSPFHCQPLAGAKNQGRTVNSRVRMLDRIPFTRALKFDMEVWHSRPTKLDYSVATFWYGDLDDTSNGK